MDYILLYTAWDHLEAQMIVAAMKENGIPVINRELGNAAILNLLRGNSSEGEEIYVPRQDFCKAQEILQGMGF